MERERESFSNRGAKRKILPENNVLTGVIGLLIFALAGVGKARLNGGAGRAAVRFAGYRR